jgi:hypothetical protein
MDANTEELAEDEACDTGELLIADDKATDAADDTAALLLTGEGLSELPPPPPPPQASNDIQQPTISTCLKKAKIEGAASFEFCSIELLPF